MVVVVIRLGLFIVDVVDGHGGHRWADIIVILKLLCVDICVC